MPHNLHHSYSQIKKDVEQLGSHIAEAASATHLKEKLQERGREADEFARDHVWWVAAGASLLGFILGSALTRKRQP